MFDEASTLLEIHTQKSIDIKKSDRRLLSVTMKGESMRPLQTLLTASGAKVRRNHA